MIKFRCWYCNKSYSVASERAGERMVCSCQSRLRIPYQSGGNCRHRSLGDWIIELVVYGGGGALLGFLFALVLLSKAYFLPGLRSSWLLVLICTSFGFVAGTLLGEAGVNWVGRIIRDHES
jgi:hypothetical protein